MMMGLALLSARDNTIIWRLWSPRGVKWITLSMWSATSSWYSSGVLHLWASKLARNKQAPNRSQKYTLQGTNISHLGKRKIIFKMQFWRDMLVSWRGNMDEHGCFALCLPSRRWQLSVALLFYHILSTAKQVSDYWNKQPVAKEIHVYIYIQSSWSFRTNQQQQQPNTKRRATEGGHQMLKNMIKHDSINIWIKGRNKHNMCCSCSNMCFAF